MDKTLTRFTSFEEAKAEEYRYWQSRTVQERVNAAAELSFGQYQWKEPTRDVHERLQRTLVRVQRAPATGANLTSLGLLALGPSALVQQLRVLERPPQASLELPVLEPLALPSSELALAPEVHGTL